MKRVMALTCAAVIGGRLLNATAAGAVSIASVDVPFPQNYVTSSANRGAPVTAPGWNKAGNRCEFACADGPTDVGLDTSAFGAVPSGLPAPILEVYSDGALTARTTGSSLYTSGGYTVYYAALKTRCTLKAPLDQDFQFCSNDTFCQTSGRGKCRMCDYTGTCNNELPNTGFAPCATAPTGEADTCYLLAGCIGRPGETCGTNCLKSGVKGDKGNPNGPLHTAVVRMLSSGSLNGDVIGQTERLYNMALADTRDPFNPNACSSNCAGGIDASRGGTTPPQCE